MIAINKHTSRSLPHAPKGPFESDSMVLVTRLPFSILVSWAIQLINKHSVVLKHKLIYFTVPVVIYIYIPLSFGTKA